MPELTGNPLSLPPVRGERRPADQPGPKSFASLLENCGFEQVLARHKRAAYIQRELDRLLPAMGLPPAMVTPGKSYEALLHVDSAAAATLLRSRLPQLTNRLMVKIGKLKLRVRTRPPLVQLAHQPTPVEIPSRHLAGLHQLAGQLNSPQLRRAVEQLISQR